MVGIELQMINPTFFFRYLQGRCHGSQICGKIVQKLPTPCTYRSVIPKRNGILLTQCALNSINDASISCENFVNSDLYRVTPEKTGLICELLVRRGKKTSVFSRISQDILDRFLRHFHHYESALTADDRSLPCFPIYRVTLPWQSIDFGKM